MSIFFNNLVSLCDIPVTSKEELSKVKKKILEENINLGIFISIFKISIIYILTIFFIYLYALDWTINIRILRSWLPAFLFVPIVESLYGFISIIISTIKTKRILTNLDKIKKTPYKIKFIRAEDVVGMDNDHDIYYYFDVPGIGLTNISLKDSQIICDELKIDKEYTLYLIDNEYIFILWLL